MTREAFVQRMNDATLGAFDIASTYLGVKLGFYRSLADGGPATAAELADRTGTNERLVREWLEQQGATELLAATNDEGEWRFALPAEHAGALLDPDALDGVASTVLSLVADMAQVPRLVVQQYLEQPATTPVIIVRHAKAMDRKDWSRKDPARPLNTRGRRQARLLVPMLEAYGITRLVSSTATRCLSTLLPYAHQRESSIESYSQLTEEEGSNDAKGVAKLVGRIRTAALADNQPTAICVHRPVLPHVLDAFEIAPATLVTGEFLVAHLTAEGEVHALERHRPQA